MPFTRASLSTIVDRIKSDFESRIDGATSLLRRSFLKVLATVNGGAFHLLYEYLDYQARQLFVVTADTAGLEAHSSEWGITRTAATIATGSGEATGVNGTVIPAGTELSSTDGVIYSTDADATIAAGVATLDFTANVAGADGNDDAGITLTFVSAIVGANTTVTVDSDGITGGADAESDDSLRARILARKRQPPFGSIENDYINWMKEVSGTTRAWTLPLYQGAGTVAVAFVRDGDTPIFPTSSQRTAMYNYLLEHTDPASGLLVGVPVTAQPGLSVLNIAATTINFEIGMYPNTAAIQADVEAELENLMLRAAAPDSTIYLSEISEAISLGIGQGYHRLISPTNDLTTTALQLHTLGTVTFYDY